MPLLYICATSPSSWSFTDSPSLSRCAIYLLFLSLRSKPPSSFLRRQPFLLLLHAARRVSASRLIYLFVAPGLGPPRSLAIPARNFWRTSEGASQLAPRPATRKYPASCEPDSSSDSGANAVIAINPAVTITIPRTKPNAAPNTRSTDLIPASWTTHLVSLAMAPAIRTTDTKIVINPSKSANAGNLTYCTNHGESRPYPNDASRKPRTAHARQIISKKKPWAAANSAENSMITRMIQSSAFMPSPAQSAGNSRPANTLYAWMYFSLVLRATSSGKAGAGGCLFHLIASR